MLYYIGYYADSQNKQNRKIVLSATNKMRYVFKVLTENNIDFQVVSSSMTTDKKYYSDSFEQVSEKMSFKQFKTFGRKNILTKLIDRYFSKIQLFNYLMKTVKKDDVLLVYHSPFFCKLIPLIKKIKKCKIILEVEEVYADVNGNKNLREKELYICNNADAFLFPTKMLSDAVNPNNKPYLLIHGTYMVEDDRENIFNDGKIHVVYAGTFDPRKGGGVAAKVAEFLDERYHVHILGFGSEQQTEDLKNEIEKISTLTKCSVTYDGCLSGEEYLNFIHSCDIGLSPQNPQASFNSTSFPSKILSYMSNGLRVVSIDIPAIKTSAVGDNLYYYQNQTPEEIAKTIMSIDLNDAYNGKEIISEMDKEFSNEIVSLLKDLENV